LLVFFHFEQVLHKRKAVSFNSTDLRYHIHRVSKNGAPLACYNFIIHVNGFWRFWQKCYR